MGEMIDVVRTDQASEVSPAMQVVALMRRAQGSIPPGGEPIGAYRSPDAPDYHLKDVPEYLYDKAPETTGQGEQ